MAVQTLNDLLNRAIEHEVSSQEFYRESIRKTKDQQIIHFLNSLVEEEESHERLLRSVQEMEIYNGATPVDEAALRSVQGSHEIEIPELSENPTMEEILEIALKRETRAFRIFQQLTEASHEPELKELFTNLAQEEMNHHKNIEKDFAARTGQMGLEG